MMIERKQKSLIQSQLADGKVVASKKNVIIPCNIAGKNVSLKTDVVKSEIPVTKQGKYEGSKVNDRINMFGKDIHLHN